MAEVYVAELLCKYKVAIKANVELF
jgi:hypothetical protein